ncbi:MAG: excinuclease ABC subunit UvrA [Lewinellaceae bacterium]|nr:excinuclease ABC subunit UvrA [Saprospiraceae bacterium]MCB9333524.1 excinuclease ABC subunit UvrA [Lewinellaceae bacterium]
MTKVKNNPAPAAAAPETDLVDPRYISIKGARVNNLQNVDLQIPKNKLVVVTGVSGSGKSSITMDTLYAEGQRRYVESLSSYARQFLGRMKKPDVDYIRGICPAIAIEQRVTTGNARSTVGSMTEIYDFLRLLYARVGKFYSPISGQEVKKHAVSDVIDFMKSQPEGSRGLILIPFTQKYKERTLEQELNLLLQKGYTRVYWQGEIQRIEEWLNPEAGQKAPVNVKDKAYTFREKNLTVLIDRYSVQFEDESEWMRLADSVNTAFYESEGECWIQPMDQQSEIVKFNNRFELDGIQFPEPTPQLFNYNNPYGACPKCEGYGRILGIDPDKVVPDKTLSVYDGAIAPWKGEKYGEWLRLFLQQAHRFDFPVHKPFEELSKAEQKLLWTGNNYFDGIDAFFKEIESKTYKIQNRVTLARYRGRTVCPECDGGRLRSEALCVRVAGKNISELTDVPLDEVLDFFNSINWSEHDQQIAKRLLVEIHGRLRFMVELGLGYLTLSRISNTLSGGETQRIHLTRTLGSNLTASMYLLDEPSVGLHPRDTDRLVNVLKDLRDLGNTVVVVEHEEEVIKNADFLVDMGPEAGTHGGHVVFAGDYADIGKAAPESLTTKYMSGEMEIPVPKQRRKTTEFLHIKGARQHNLKKIDVSVPLHCLTVVTGVSGSGKTTLVRDILYPALLQNLPEGPSKKTGLFDGLEGPVKKVTRVEFVNQSPIGKSSRSNPVTYVKAYDYIRDLFSRQQLSKIRGFKPKHFSFNVEGGRCEACKGEGEQVVEMQFLADVHLECEECKGRRFQQEVLDVEYKGQNIFDVLEMSIEEALDFFKGQKEIVERIQPLNDVGLGYVKLGQSSSTLSGGEAQRVKLASFLIRDNSAGHIFFIFDEPTTGLHFHDIRKLLTAINALVEKGHSVLVVEHNVEVIKNADWVIDLGPEGGKAGGQLVFEGRPEDLAKEKKSYTGQFLKEKL